MSSEDSLHSSVSYQKLPGTLILTSPTLSWTPSSSSSSSSVVPIALPLASVSGLSVSKAGSANVALQIAFDEQGIKATGIQKAKILFTFTGGVSGDKAKAEDEREAFKTKLVDIIAENRRVKGGPSESSTTGTAAVGTPPAQSKPATPSATGTSTPIRTKPAQPTELSLRISILKSNPSLAALHKQTVIAGLIPDSEFWSHPARQTLLRSARQAATQQKGRNARIVDPRFQVDKNGQLNLEITEEVRRDLLEQNDVLRLAWKENVPDKLDESSFWQRYFTSSLYHMIRTSSRSASLLSNSRTAQGGTTSLSASVKPDAIFDAYLPLVRSRYVDTLEAPEKQGQQQEARNRLIDLGATESDHNPTGNEKDWTMRAGADRGVLPLVRRFNEHSERVLSSSLGDGDTRPAHSAETESAEQIGPRQRKKARTEGERGVELDDAWRSQHAQRYEEEIVIDDLEERRERMAMPLELRGGDGGEEGLSRRRGGAGTLSSGKTKTTNGQQHQRSDRTNNDAKPSRPAMVKAMRTSIASMPSNGVISLNLTSTSTSTSSIETSLRQLLEARKTRSWTDLNDLPDHLKKKTLDIHGSATEVMRQFWNAVSAADNETVAKVEEGETPPPPPTPAEREAKAKRMMGILGRIVPQAEEVLHQSGGGVDEEKIASALGITLEACQRAMAVGQMVYSVE